MSSYDHERTPQSLGTGVRKKLAFWAILVSICCFLISIYYRKIENDETAKNFFIVSIGCVFVFSSEFFLILKAFPKNTIIDKKIKEGKKRLAELEAEEIIEPKIYDDAEENNYAEGKLEKDNNVKKKPMLSKSQMSRILNAKQKMKEKLKLLRPTQIPPIMCKK